MPVFRREKDMIAFYLAMIDSPEEKNKFTLVYEKYRNLMFYVANGILKDELLSEDAVQEAFIRIAKNIRKIDDVNSPSTKRFIVIIVENVAKSMYVKHRNSSDHEEFCDDMNYKVNVDSVFTNVSAKELVEEILNLPEKQRKILYLYEIYGYKYSEIAYLLGMKEPAVRKQAQRARDTLKERSHD